MSGDRRDGCAAVIDEPTREEILRRIRLLAEAFEAHLITYEGVEIDRDQMRDAFVLIADTASQGLSAKA